LPGTTLYDGGLAVGAGTHGGLLAAELHIVMMLAGSAIEANSLSDWPAGLIDIAPTALALLGIQGGATMDGRVLNEAIAGAPDPIESVSPETWEAHGPGYNQRLARTRIGQHIYLDAGYRS
jgi:arylsulfatase A-like enzyme